MNRFMMGRYGMDELNRFLLYVSLAFVVIGLFIHVRLLTVVTVILLIILYSRMFSRSIENRQRENMKYLEIKGRFFKGKTGNGAYGGYDRGYSDGYGGGAYAKGSKAGGFGRKNTAYKNDGKRVLICPICKEKLRVPVGAGRIKVKCPHCNSEFEETV